MPIKIPNGLPAAQTLAGENIFVMDETRAVTQDIRPLQILVLNLMPTKIETETQLSRLLGNTPLQVELEFLHTSSHESKNTAKEHLFKFYQVFSEVRRRNFDGMVVTGAPVEQMEYEEVQYWDELTHIMDWSKTNVTSTLHICWGAQAGLYYHYGIPKYLLPQKAFGIFEHRVHHRKIPLLRGFDDVFWAPHSRNTGVDSKAIAACDDLLLLADSPEVGELILMAQDGRQIFVLGHLEYDRLTLDKEYKRDIAKGIDIALPENYYPNDDPDQKPLLRWRGAANAMYSNWINYYVYQETPFEFINTEAVLSKHQNS